MPPRRSSVPVVRSTPSAIQDAYTVYRAPDNVAIKVMVAEETLAALQQAATITYRPHGEG